MQTRRVVTIIFVAGMLTVAEQGRVQAVGSRFDTLNAPQAGTNQGQGTWASGINSHGDIVGNFVGGKSVEHGFLLHQGHYTVLDAPKAGTKKGPGTFAAGINSQGNIVGFYFDANNVTHGFLLHHG